MILDRHRTLGEILAEALVLYRRDWLTYLAVAFVAIVPAELVVNGLALGELSAPYDDGGVSTGAATIGFALTFVVTGPLATAMSISVLVEREADRDPSAASAIQRGLEVFGPLLLAMALVGVAVTVGLILLVVPGLFLAVRLSVTAVAVVVEGRRAQHAMARSLELTEGSFWRVAGVLLVTNLIASAAAALVVSAPLQVVAEATGDGGWAFAGTVLGTMVAAPFASIATVLLFGDLRARRADAEAQAAAAEAQAAAPAPSAAEATTSGDDRARP